MSQADLLKTYLEDQLGEPYVWGDEGPDTHDCSGLHFEAYRAAGILCGGRPWPRLTANDYKNMARAIQPPYKVGDPVFFLGSSGKAYHVATVSEIDSDGLDGYTVEARGRAWGVVKYRISDPANGVKRRGGRFYRYPGVDLGELTEADMTEDQIRELVQQVVRDEIEKVYSSDVTEAQAYLVREGILRAERPRHRAASVGYVDLVTSRVHRLLK